MESGSCLKFKLQLKENNRVQGIVKKRKEKKDSTLDRLKRNASRI
jgi:hypothetical protein